MLCVLLLAELILKNKSCDVLYLVPSDACCVMVQLLTPHPRLPPCVKPTTVDNKAICDVCQSERQCTQLTETTTTAVAE